LADAGLIQSARKQVDLLLAADPTLEKHPALAQSLARIDEDQQSNLAKG
jgi:hypothetical protein